jgi:hypothetical protein
MALSDKPPKSKRAGVIEAKGQVPKVGGGEGNEEDTETAIETPYARDKVKDDDDSADSAESERDEDERDEDEGEASEREPKAAERKASAEPADASRSAKTDPPAAPGAPDPIAPWLVPIYVLSLLLLFVGERIIQGDDVLRYAFSGLGVAGAVLTTAYRRRAAFGARTERLRVERLLALLMAGGLLAIAIYFSTTEAGKNLLHLSTLKPETRARVADATLVVWVVLLAISVTPLVFGEIALAPMRRAERVEVRRVRAATIAGATLAFAASYVGLFAYAAGELDMKVDFSYFRTARPGESTKNIAKSLNEPLEITAFFPQLNEVGDEVKGYLTELSAAAPQVQVKFQDRLLVPALAKELKVTQDGVLVLKRGDSRETLSVGAEMKNAQNKLKTLDADFQKSLLKVMRSQRVAYFTVGHGELNEQTGPEAQTEGRSTKNLRRLLESQNYAVKDLGLPQGLAANVPEDATIVFVLGPSQAVSPAEVDSLKRYLDKGGRLVMALDPDFKVDLAPLAAIAGLTWKPALLATDDPRHFYPLRHNDSDHVILITNRFSSHASVSSLSKISQRTAVVLRGAAALDKAEGATQKVDFAVRALPETFADENGNFVFDKDTEKRNAYGLAAAVSKPTGEKDKDGKDKEARAFVIGDADALGDAAVGDTPNGLLALDVIRWLGGDESFLGGITSAEDVKIEHTKQKDTVWFYGTIFAVPLMVLGVGYFTTQRRRKRARRAA